MVLSECFAGQQRRVVRPACFFRRMHSAQNARRWCESPNRRRNTSNDGRLCWNDAAQLLIFTGVAIPNSDSQRNLDTEEVIVRLGATTTPNFEATAVVGLASIHNDNSDFWFATDSATVDTDPTDGTLRLHVPIAVQGNPSLLSRFSYMVNVLSDPITSKIAGLISWPRLFGDPTFGVLNGGNPMFRIAVGQTISIPPAPGSLFGSTQFIENTAGFSSLPVLTGDAWVAAYEVDNVPLGQQWQVQPALLSGTLVGPPPGYIVTPGFSPQQVVQLTPSNPAASGVDFAMAFGEAPH